MGYNYTGHMEPSVQAVYEDGGGEGTCVVHVKAIVVCLQSGIESGATVILTLQN